MPSHLSHSAGSYSPSSSPDDHRPDEQPTNTNGQNEEDDLMILHIPSDEGEELASGSSSIKGMEVLPRESKAKAKSVVGRRSGFRVIAVWEYKNRRASVANANESAPQWNEKHTSDRDMPEMMEQGLMG